MCSTRARRRRRRSTRRPASPGNDATPAWSFSRRGGRVVRVPARARRDGGVRLGVLLGPEEPTTSRARPTAATSSRVRARDAAGNTGAAASSSYVLDTSAPARAVDRLGARVPGQRRHADVGLLRRGGRVVRVPAGARRDGGLRLGVLLGPEDLRPLLRGRRQLQLLGARDRRRRQHRRGGDLRLHARPRRPGGALGRCVAAVPGQRAQPVVGFSGEAGAAFECRLTRGATVISDWAGLLQPAACTTCCSSPTAPTPSRCAPPTPPATPARPRLRLRARHARARGARRSTRRRPRRAATPRRPGASRARRARRSSAGSSAARPWCRTGRPARTRGVRPVRRAGRQLRLLGARHRRRRQHGRGGDLVLRARHERARRRRRSTRRPRRRATTPRRRGASQRRGRRVVRVPPRARRDRGVRLGVLLGPEDLRPIRRAGRQLRLLGARNRRGRQHGRRRRARATSSTPAPRPRHRSTRRRRRRAATGRPRGPSRARRAGRSSAAWCAARRWCPTGPPARARRPTTSAPSPTATTSSACARATPRATRAARRPPTTRSTARSLGAHDRLGAGPDRQRRDAGLELLRRCRRELRVPRGARRDGRCRLGGLLEPARPSTSARSRTAATASSSRAERAGNRSAPATSDYVLDRAAPARAVDRLGAALAGQRRHAGLGASRARRGPRFECRLDARRHGGLRLGKPARAPRASTSPRSPTAPTPSRCGPPTRPATPAPRRARRYDLDTAAPAAPSIDSAPASPGTSGSPSWAFSGEAGASFECRLARGATVVSDWAACASPPTTTSPSEPDGSYDFSVRATDAAGNTGAAGDLEPTCSTGPARPPRSTPGPAPRATTARPSGASPPRPARASSAASSAAAALVSDWAACSRPKGYDLSSEPDGDYTFSVRATDAAGQPGRRGQRALRARRGRARGAQLRRRARLADGGPDPGLVVRGRAWRRPGMPPGARRRDRSPAGPHARARRASTSPARADGSYTLSVRATDAAGNTGAGRILELRARHHGAEPARHHRRPGPQRQRRHAPRGGSAPRRAPASTAACAGGADTVSARGPCASPAGLRARLRAGRRLRLLRARARRGRQRERARRRRVRAPPRQRRRPPSRAATPAACRRARARPTAIRALPCPGPRRAPVWAGGPQCRCRAADRRAAGTIRAPPWAAEQAQAPRPPRSRHGPRRTRARPCSTPSATLPAPWRRNADKSVFPGLLIAMVLSFFGIQNRIDRNDPKLGLAPVFADPDLEFGPPPTKTMNKNDKKHLRRRGAAGGPHALHAGVPLRARAGGGARRSSSRGTTSTRASR